MRTGHQRTWSAEDPVIRGLGRAALQSDGRQLVLRSSDLKNQSRRRTENEHKIKTLSVNPLQSLSISRSMNALRRGLLGSNSTEIESVLVIIA